MSSVLTVELALELMLVLAFNGLAWSLYMSASFNTDVVYPVMLVIVLRCSRLDVNSKHTVCKVHQLQWDVVFVVLDSLCGKYQVQQSYISGNYVALIACWIDWI